MEKRKLLLVDDEPQIVDLLSMAFSDYFDVTSTSSGNEAVDLYRQKHFDAILTDYSMPNGTGLDLIRQVNQLPKKAPHIYIMSANFDPNFEELEKLGVDAVFEKPFDLDHFLEVCCTSLDMSPPTKKVRRSIRMPCGLLVDFFGAGITSVVCLGVGGFRSILKEENSVEINQKISLKIFPPTELDFSYFIKGQAVCRWKKNIDGKVHAGFEFVKEGLSRESLLRTVNYLQVSSH